MSAPAHKRPPNTVGTSDVVIRCHRSDTTYDLDVLAEQRPFDAGERVRIWRRSKKTKQTKELFGAVVECAFLDLSGEFTDENTRVDSTGRRHCRTCERARSRERSQLRKEVRLEFVPRGQLASCLALVACLFLAACDASPTNTLRCASICEEAGAGGMGTFRRAGGYWDCTCRFSPEDS